MTVVALLLLSLPKEKGEIALAGLGSEVTIDFDAHDVPTIVANDRFDAYRALGWLHASRRLFQMDLNRRKMTGTLSAIIGPATFSVDVIHRRLGLSRVAGKIVDRLPPGQRALCSAYAQGVNAWLSRVAVLPPEFLALGYRPAPWSCKDTLLIILSMFEVLDEIGDQERMLTVMYHTLPKDLVDFLTPDTDPLDTLLLGKPCGHRPTVPTPVKAIRTLMARYGHHRISGLVTELSPAASNQWALRTREGTLLANDMHLPLQVPNLWYLARLRYRGIQIEGVTLPGVPGIVAGSNGRVAWGFTNAMADVRDWVMLDTHPEHPDQYKVPNGWESFQHRRETIAIRGQSTQSLTVLTSRWGPVMEPPLLGSPVALHWTALDHANIDLKLLDMDRIGNVSQAIQLFKRAGIPVQNVIVADAAGHIGWTLSGHLPKRRGFDGTLTASWAEGNRSWEGVLTPTETPSIIDPASGFLVTANQRTVGCDLPLRIGHNFALSWRARMIQQSLQRLTSLDSLTHLRLQLATGAEFYRFYQKLALSVETGDVSPLGKRVRKALESWNGKAEEESLGLPLLDRFHRHLANALFTPLLVPCHETDPLFRYGWLKKEVPLRRLLSEQHPETLPDPAQGDWKGFLRHHLQQVAAELETAFGKPIDTLTWGDVNRARIRHPLSHTLPVLSRWLDMPNDALPGCRWCIRVASPGYGASMRMVVPLRHSGKGILHMPTGQAGHFLSAHYRDLHPFWLEGRPLPLATAPSQRRLHLVPLR